MSFTDDEGSTPEREGQRPSASNPLFVFEPPSNIAGASKEEVRAWASQIMQVLRQEHQRDQETE
jgi:hypothetical protein